MSISINGYKIKAKNFKQMNYFLSSLREDVIKEQKKYYLKNIAEQFCSYLDKVSLGLEKRENQKLAKIRRDYSDRQEEVYKTSRRDPEIDISFSLCWYYYRNNFYAIIFTDREELVSLFEGQKLVEDYKYYNHSDPPEGMSYSQFRKRLKIWDKIIPSGIPNKHGYCLEINPSIVDFLNFGEDKDYFKHQPSLQKRAEDLLIDILCKENKVNNFSQYLDVLKSVRNKKNKDMKERLRNLKTKIKRKYKKEDFI